MHLKPTVRPVNSSAEVLSGTCHWGSTGCEVLGSSDNINSQSNYKISQSQSGQNITQGPIIRRQGQDNASLPVSTAVRSVAKVKGSSADSKAAGSKSATLSSPSRSVGQNIRQATGQREGNWKFFGASVNQNLKADEVVEKMDSGQLWVVNSRRRNGIIVLREFHAEFAGPGAAVGGDLDTGIVKIIPIGNLSLLEPDSHEAHQNAIKIRLQWIRLTQNFTDQASPDDRARMILEQFKTYFDQTTVDLVPDEAFAMLVGVLPQTIHRVRSSFVW